MAIFRAIFRFSGYFNLWRLSPKNNLKRFLGYPPVRLGISGRNSGKTPETLSELFLEFPSRVRLGSPKPYHSRHSKAPEHFQNSLPPSTAGDASFCRSGFGEGLSEPVMDFPAVLGGIPEINSAKIISMRFSAKICVLGSLCHLSSVPLSAP